MAKIKKPAKWDTCPYALFPFGSGMPICAYGVKHKENISLKDFYHCMNNGICRKEHAEAQQKPKEN